MFLPMELPKHYGLYKVFFVLTRHIVALIRGQKQCADIVSLESCFLNTLTKAFVLESTIRI